MRGRYLEFIWREVAPIVAFVLALLLTVWMRDTDSAQYPDMQPNSYHQSQWWSADDDPQALWLTRSGS
jgi:hypothetical protein